MMREIKFRVWDERSQRMYYDVGIFPNKCKTPMSISSDGLFYHPLYPEFGNLMQYTGLKANGKEIYEGDIVQDMDNEIYRVVYGGQFNYASFGIERERKNHEFGSRPMTWDVLNETWQKDLEIIGNIYENAELLKEI